MQASPPLHPCQTCGACCAFFRVSFYWRETEDPGNGRLPVPQELTEGSDKDFRLSMKGTSSKHHTRCVALEGRLGEQVGCSIYTLRPSPCREFEASFEDGTHNQRCDTARARYNMPPLKLKDWAIWREAARLPATPVTCYNPGHDELAETAPESPSP